MLWCWLTGVFGIATKYSESLIAVKYRVKTKDGRMQGGAMYALERGLNMRWLGLLFAFFGGFASFVSDVPHRLMPLQQYAMKIFTSRLQRLELQLPFSLPLLFSAESNPLQLSVNVLFRLWLFLCDRMHHHPGNQF